MSLDSWLSMLSSSDRVALRLRLEFDFKTPDIAAVMKWTDAEVHASYQRALRLVRLHDQLDARPDAIKQADLRAMQQ